MPHLTIEYTDNLSGFDSRTVLSALNSALIASGHFDAIDIKSRAIRLETFLIGSTAEQHAFVHAKLALMPRPAEVKKALSDALLAALQKVCPVLPHYHLQLSVEVQDLDSGCYGKTMLSGT